MKFFILFISILCIIFPSAAIMEAEGFWGSLLKFTGKGAQKLTQKGMKTMDDFNLNPYQLEKQIKDMPVTITEKSKSKSSPHLSSAKHSDFIIEEVGEESIQNTFTSNQNSESYTAGSLITKTVLFDQRYDTKYNFSIDVPSAWSSFELETTDFFTDEEKNEMDEIELQLMNEEIKIIAIGEDPDDLNSDGLFLMIFPTYGELELDDFISDASELGCDGITLDAFGGVCKDAKLLETSRTDNKLIEIFSSMDKDDGDSEFKEFITKFIITKNSNQIFILALGDYADEFHSNSINEHIENSFYVPQTNNQTDSSGIIIIIGIIFGVAIIGFIVMKNKKTQNQNLKNTARNLSE